MHALAQFDRLLTRIQPAQSTQTPLTLLDPEGQPRAEFEGQPAAEELLQAAYRLAADDWCEVLADEGASRGLRPGWRLALFRADRHGQPRIDREGRPLWLSPVLHAQLGEPAAALKARLQALAVQALWQSGWRLQA